MIAYVREQLGEAPCFQIAQALSYALREDNAREFSLPGLVQFVEERGFDWRNVHVVVEKLALSPMKFLERSFLSLTSDPPAVVQPAEVARRLRESLDDPGPGRQAWLAWAKDIRVVWRRSAQTEDRRRSG